MLLIERRCKHCKHVVTTHQEFYSFAICPYCWHDSGGTVLDVTQHPYRLRRCGKWWQFWKYERVYTLELYSTMKQKIINKPKLLDEIRECIDDNDLVD